MCRPNKSRIFEIEVMRLIASFIIMMYHMSMLPGGYLAVEFFAVLTGVLFARSIDCHSPEPNTNIVLATKAFVVRKIKVFYPELFIATILGLICHNYLKYPILDGFTYVLQSLVGNMLLMKMSGLSWCAQGALPPVWYLSSMILSIIIIYPLFLKIKSHTCALIIGIILFFILYIHEGGVMRSSFCDWVYCTYSGNIRVFSEFLIAIGVAPCINLIASLLTYKVIYRIIFAALQYVALMGIFILFLVEPGKTDALFLCLVLLYVVVSFARACSHPVQHRMYISSKYLKYLGSASIAVFLTHAPALMVSGGLQTRLALGKGVYVVLSLIVTIIFSFICIYGGEMFRKKKVLQMLKDS